MVIRALAWAPVGVGAVSPPARESPRATSGSSADTRRVSSAPPNAATARTPTAARLVFNRMLVLHRSAAGSSVGILPGCRPPQPSDAARSPRADRHEAAEQERVGRTAIHALPDPGAGHQRSGEYRSPAR